MAKLLSFIFFALFLINNGCAPGWYYQTKPSPQKGVYHLVEPGQTLWRIARTYGVPLEEIARANNIKDATSIKAGRHIFIPGATKVLKVDAYKPPELEERREERETLDEVNFIWPVKGKVLSGFGRRGGRVHNGIDIGASKGTDFVASADGVVSYSGTMRGFGNVIILKHNKVYFTIYAHNQINLVEEGSKVKQNQVIGKIGDTGRATCPHLHFEIRRYSRPEDPILYLP